MYLELLINLDFKIVNIYLKYFPPEVWSYFKNYYIYEFVRFLTLLLNTILLISILVYKMLEIKHLEFTSDSSKTENL